MCSLHFRSFIHHRSLCTLSVCNIGTIISSFQRKVIIVQKSAEIKLICGSVDFSTNSPFVAPYFLSLMILIFIMW